MNFDKIKFVIDKKFWGKVWAEIRSFLKKFNQASKTLSLNERRIIIVLSLIVLVCATILFRNYYLTQTISIPKKGGIYIEGVVGNSKYLNPLLAHSEVDRNISRIIFLPLVAYNDKGELQPVLAREFKILDEAKKYDFVLDERIHWHDGEKITSDDIEFNLAILQSEDYTGPYAVAFEGVLIEKRSPTEFSLILPEINSGFITILTELGIVPKHKLVDIKPELLDKSDFNTNPIGSGKYSFDPKKSKKNGHNEVVLVRAETYQKDQPGYLDEVIFRSYGSSQELIDAYKKGEINGFGGFNNQDIISIERKTFRFNELLIPRFTAIFLNLDNDNLKISKFRQALAHATDKSSIVLDVYGKGAEVLRSPLSSFTPGYNPDIGEYIFHLPTSETYLASLGFIDTDKDGIREKDGKKLELTLYTTDDPSLQKVAQLTAENWLKVGVKANVIVIDLVTLQKTIIPSGQYDILILGENLDYPPDPYPYFHSSQAESGLNFSNYKNLAVDELLEEARLASNQEVKAEKLKTFSKIVAKDQPAIFLCSAPYYYGANISIKGITKKRIAENSSDRFLEIGSWYIKSEKKRK